MISKKYWSVIMNISVSSAEMDKLLAIGSGDAALLYIYARKNGISFPKAMPGFDQEQLQQARRQLCRAGLLAGSDVRQDQRQRPGCDSTEIAQSLSDPAFAYVVRQTEQLLGKTLSGQDLRILYDIYARQGFPPEVLLLLVNYCLGQQERRGSGRKPTLRQIDKEAAVWAQEGLFGADLAEEYINRKEKNRQASSEALRQMNIFREPSPTEKKYVNEWLALGFGHEAIALAYDKTVVNTGKLTWGYCGAILKRWHEANVHTLAEIEALECKNKPAPAALKTGDTKSALARNQELLRRMGNEE
jgi:DnaD/phage-associated family protein